MSNELWTIVGTIIVAIIGSIPGILALNRQRKRDLIDQQLERERLETERQAKAKETSVDSIGATAEAAAKLSEGYQRLIDELREEIAEVRNRLDKTEQREQTWLDEIKSLRHQLDALTAKDRERVAEIAWLGEQLELAQAKIEEQGTELAELRAERDQLVLANQHLRDRIDRKVIIDADT